MIKNRKTFKPKVYHVRIRYLGGSVVVIARGYHDSLHLKRIANRGR